MTPANTTLNLNTAHFGIFMYGIFSTTCSSVSAQRAQFRAALR